MTTKKDLLLKKCCPNTKSMKFWSIPLNIFRFSIYNFKSHSFFLLSIEILDKIIMNENFIQFRPLYSEKKQALISNFFILSNDLKLFENVRFIL